MLFTFALLPSIATIQWSNKMLLLIMQMFTVIEFLVTRQREVASLMQEAEDGFPRYVKTVHTPSMS